MSRRDAICHRGLRACRVLNKKKKQKKTKSVKSIQITPENVKYSLTSRSALRVLMVVDVRSSAGKILFIIITVIIFYYFGCSVFAIPQCSVHSLSSLLSLHFHSSHLREKKKKKNILRSSVTTVKRISPNPCEVLHLLRPLRLCHRKAQKEKGKKK